jgi:hypothetical protein
MRISPRRRHAGSMSSRWRAALIAIAVACAGGLLAGFAVAGAAPESPDIGDPVVLTPDPADVTSTPRPRTTASPDLGTAGDDTVRPVPRSPRAWGGRPPVEDDVGEGDDGSDSWDGDDHEDDDGDDGDDDGDDGDDD